MAKKPKQKPVETACNAINNGADITLPYVDGHRGYADYNDVVEVCATVKVGNEKVFNLPLLALLQHFNLTLDEFLIPGGTVDFAGMTKVLSDLHIGEVYTI